MVITEQVQDTMDQQLVETLIYAEARRPPLPCTGIHGDDHITQQMGINVSMGPLAHGKCNDVGGSLALQIIPVELSDALIIHYQDGQLRFRRAQGV